MGEASATDKAVVVVFCPNLNLAQYNASAANRSAGAASIDVSSFKGQSVETWIAFLSADGKEASNSTYTGKLTIA